jgi:hypothetical protein
MLMTRPRERRPKPEPVSAEEAAEIEAKYRELWRLLRRYSARMDARRALDGGDPP